MKLIKSKENKVKTFICSNITLHTIKNFKKATRAQ